MNRLWDYEDYVNHLSHQNKIVRRWAFATIENHYPNRYISWASGGSEYFRNLTEFPQQNILENRGDAIDNYILGDTTIELDKTLRENMIQSFKNGLYENFITAIIEQGRLENGGKIIPFQRDSPIIGRNEPCPCGRGKKYKKCYLNKISPV